MSTTSKWILGLDLREGAEGPLVFARWLCDRLATAILDPIHVIEQDQIGLLATADKPEQVVSLAEDAVARTLGRVGVTTPLANLRLAEVGEPQDVLAAAARDADGLI